MCLTVSEFTSHNGGMIQHVQAIYENGVLKPLGPLNLRDRDVVSLFIEPMAPRDSAASLAEPTLFDAFDAAGLIGCVKDAPPDLSSNPKYLAGFGSSGE